MKVAAVVVHYRSLESLPGCLEALGSPDELEVVVVDNASPDGGEDPIRRRFPRTRWVSMGRNSGYGAAVNAGASTTRSDWILALNPDTRIRGEDAIAMAREAERLEAVALGPRIVDPDGHAELSYRSRDSIAGDLRWMLDWNAGRAGTGARAGTEAGVGTGATGAGTPVEVAFVTGACLLLRRVEFERAGGFDERFFLYFEDADLCRRLRRGGGRIFHHPGFTATHLRGASSRMDDSEREIAYRRSQIQFVDLHRPVLWRRVVRWSLLARAGLLASPWSSREARARGEELRAIARTPEPVRAPEPAR